MCAGASLVVVVSAALRDVELAVLYTIDKTVFLVDPSTEESLQVFFQCFRIANALHRAVSLNVFDECVYSLEGFPILCLPIQVVVPCLV